MKIPLLPWRARAFEVAGKQAALAGCEATSAGLFSPADRAYMKVLVLGLGFGSSWPNVVNRHSAKIAGQAATAKAKMNGFAPSLDWLDYLCYFPSYASAAYTQ